MDIVGSLWSLAASAVLLAWIVRRRNRRAGPGAAELARRSRELDSWFLVYEAAEAQGLDPAQAVERANAGTTASARRPLPERRPAAPPPSFRLPGYRGWDKPGSWRPAPETRSLRSAEPARPDARTEA